MGGVKAFMTLHGDERGDKGVIHVDVMAITDVAEDDGAVWVGLSSGTGYYVTESVDYIFEKMEAAFAHLDS
ncbi:hypothetical protein SEA_UGENIE5_36 [Mycobacterium phage Ugenie5]|nr:hypothetical protein SEA_SCHERZO_39 [Mycobacterium phage Scherzo]QBI96356.1 hypothetical protein SEA_UGENIE5_36 [Mycobacterium phage Ugenie5]